MPTIKLYNLDAYLKKFTAKVISIKAHEGKYAVELDRTCFFPESGGQPSDTGYINGIRVSYVFELRESVFHVCDAPFNVGEEINGKIDFETRFQYMQIHTAEHILSSFFQNGYKLKNVGFHIGKQFNTIDLDSEINGEITKESEYFVNKNIYSNVNVKTFFPSNQELQSLKLRKKVEVNEGLRIVEIGDSDITACCGTHVKFTGEIGLFKITDVKRYKKGSRITFLAGRQALDDYMEKHDSVSEISLLFSSKPGDAVRCVKNNCQEITWLKHEVAELRKQIVSFQAEKFLGQTENINGIPVVCIFKENVYEGELRQTADILIKKDNIFAALFSSKEGKLSYVLAKNNLSGVDTKKICCEINASFNGKGGGSAVMCQGTLNRNEFEMVKKTILRLLG